MITNNATIISGLMAQSGIPEVQSTSKSNSTEGVDFQSMFSNVSADTKSEEVLPVAKSDKQPVDYKAENSKMGKEQVNIEKKTGSTDKTEEAINELEGDIKETVQEALGVTEEELEIAMETLGLTVVDLLEPGNLMQVMMELSGNDNPIEIITDADMSQMFKSISENLTQLVTEVSQELDVTAEEVVSLLQTNEIASEEINFEDLLVDEEVEMFVSEEAEPEQVVQVTEGETADSFEASEENDNKSEIKTETQTNESVLSKLDSTVRQAFEVAPTAEQVTPVDVENIIRQVNEALRINATNEATTMELQLNPENLGKLNIQVVSKNGVITATIQATEEAVKNALETQMIALKDTLNEQGIKVDAVEVTIASYTFEDQGESEKNNNNEQTGKGRRNGFVDDVEETEEVLPEVGSDSLINYRA